MFDTFLFSLLGYCAAALVVAWFMIRWSNG